MPPPLAAFAIAAAATDALGMVPRLRDRKATCDEALAFCRCLRIAAVGQLLVMARVSEFLADLERSAKAMVHWVRGAPGVLPAGKATPFLDAVACGDSESAAGIAGAASSAWQRDQEYEDDFLYMQFLMAAWAGDDPRQQAARLARYEQVLDGAADPRLDICRALHSHDAAAFDAALGAHMARRYASYEQRLCDDLVDPDEAVTTELVSIEGLALVQLAARADLPCAGEHLLLPGLARRIDLRRPLAPDGWQEIVRYGVVA